MYIRSRGPPPPVWCESVWPRVRRPFIFFQTKILFYGHIFVSNFNIIILFWYCCHGLTGLFAESTALVTRRNNITITIPNTSTYIIIAESNCGSVCKYLFFSATTERYCPLNKTLMVDMENKLQLKN